MRAAKESPIVVVPSNVSETALRTNLPNGASDLLSCLDGARKVDRFWPSPGRDNATPLRRNDYALPTLSFRVVTDNCDSANPDVYSGAMRRLDRYILGQIFWWTVFVSACLICIVWLSQSLQFVEMIVNRGLSIPMFVYFTALLIPTFLSMILPIALLFAVLFTFNKLTVDSELVVMRAAGVSQWSLARPAIILGTVATLIGYGLSLYLVPTLFRTFKDLQFRLRNAVSTVMLQEGVFNPVIKGVTVYVRARTESGELLGIIVHDGRNHDQPITMMAERGAIVTSKPGTRIVMINGNRQETRKDGALTLLHFERYEFEIAGLAKTPHPRWREPRERYLNELFFSADQSEKVWSYQLLRMEGHYRLVSPLLSICFVIVGLAFLLSGEFNRRGQLKRVVGCIGVIIAIEVSLLSMKSSGQKLPELAGLIYLCPLLPALFGGYVLFMRKHPHQRAAANQPD